MPQPFSRGANLLPALSLFGALFGGVFFIVLVWYYFSPEFIDVGHAPEQPVPYSHRLHVGQLGLDCRYCHTNVEMSSLANVPSTQTCMNCHSQIKTESARLLPVRESWASGEAVEWVKVNYLAEYVQFSHAVHVNVGVGCETCHGRIDRMEVVSQTEPLSMGWCLECHRQPELYLRPKDQVTTMGYVHPPDFVQRNLDRIASEAIAPPSDCSACHY
jgi:hypothetical protein